MLTPGQVAKRLQVDDSTVRRWIHEGRLRAHKTLGGHWRIDPKDLPASTEYEPGSED